MKKWITKKVNIGRFKGCSEIFLISVMLDLFPELGYEQKQEVLAFAVELGREKEIKN